jgi:hypothetical protein
MPFRIIPERSERPEHLIQSARAKGADIFDEDVARLEDFDRFGVLEPEPAAFASEPGAFSGEADVLAGEASAQEINGFNGSPINCANVSIPFDVRPVLSEDSLAPRINLTLPLDGESCSFKPKVKPSYTSKETANLHVTPLHSSTRTPLFPP